MKKSAIQYTVVTAFIFLGAIGLSQTGLFTAGEALLHAITLFVVVNILLALRFLLGWLKRAIYKREMQNPKYQESDLSE